MTGNPNRTGVTRKLNFTGRKRIDKSRFSISVVREDGRVASFRLERLNLEGLDLPPDAEIYLEAGWRYDLKGPVSCGTVGKWLSTENHPAAEIDMRNTKDAENYKLSIIVIDPKTKKILASAYKITPEKQEEERQSILPVEFKDTGNQLYRVVYEDDDGGPILCINEKVPRHFVRRPQFITQIYPAVLKEILMRIVFIDGVSSVSNPQTEWHKRWLKFAETLNRTPKDFLEESALGGSTDSKLRAYEWIEDVVVGFCDRHVGELNQILSEFEQQTGGEDGP